MGMAVGCGLYAVALAATALILFILVWFERIENTVSKRSESRIIRIRVGTILDNIDAYRKALADSGVQLSSFFVEYDFEQNETRLNLVVVLRQNVDLVDLFHKFRGLYPTKSITLANQINI